MSKLIVEFVNIDKVEPHPNADKLDLVYIKGWCCVTSKGTYKVNDLCIYVPIDSVLPDNLMDLLFQDSKIKPTNGRIRTIKIRGCVSQGLIINPKTVELNFKAGTDVADRLNIVKYEPPQRIGAQSNLMAKPKRKQNENFRKYTDIENYKNYKDVFAEGEMVSVTEKVHGSNARVGWVKTSNNNLIRRILKFLRLLPTKEFVYGSHNVQLQQRGYSKKAYYKTNIYEEMVTKYQLKEKTMDPNNDIVIYGEVYGDGIQNNYKYGCKSGERKFVAFDAMINGQYLNPDDFFKFCLDKDIPTVLELYHGPFNEARIKELVAGASKMCPEQKVIEGVVIKPIVDCVSRCGRKVLKLINDEYLLLKNNTDYH